MFKLQNKIKVEQYFLNLDLSYESYFSIEDLSKELGIDYSELQHIIHEIRIQKGWSIQRCNNRPYWTYFKKMFGELFWFRELDNRGRAKGIKYNHDHAEPEWCRTHFKIFKRPND